MNLGFADGESSFHVSITKNNKYKTGFQVKQEFAIELHSKYEYVLIKEQLSVGNIIVRKTQRAVILRVSSIKELEIIIAFFDKYVLIT